MSEAARECFLADVRAWAAMKALADEAEALEARVAALTAWAAEADALREAVLRWSGESSESERHMGRDDFAAAGRADDAAQAALERADEIAGNMTPIAALAAADRPEATTPQEGNA